MIGQLILLHLSDPINALPPNAGMGISFLDVSCEDNHDRDHWYVVRVMDENSDVDGGIEYTVTTEDGHEFTVPKNYIKSIQFATEDQIMMYTMSFNQVILNDEVDSLARLVSHRIKRWVSDGLTPDLCTDVLSELTDKCCGYLK